MKFSEFASGKRGSKQLFPGREVERRGAGNLRGKVAKSCVQAIYAKMEREPRAVKR